MSATPYPFTVRASSSVGTGFASAPSNSVTSTPGGMPLEAALSPVDRVAASAFGSAVAVSGDGTTALASGLSDGSSGAVWALARSGAGWVEQQKLTLISSSLNYNSALALSADGTTALVGGTEAVVVYTRSGSVWSEQQKLAPSDFSDPTCPPGQVYFGSALALSPDGNTAVIGAPGDGAIGSVRVFTRSGSTWTEQPKIVPTDAAAGCVYFGRSVAMSADGTRVVIGGGSETWVYTHSGSTWSEEQKIAVGTSTAAMSADGSTALIGSGAYTRSGSTWSLQQAISLPGGAFKNVAVLSPDGNTAAFGAFTNDQTGSAFVYHRSTGTWSLQQTLAPGDRVGPSRFGAAVALAGGSTLLIGGPGDSRIGALWTYTLSVSTWSEQQKLAQPADATPTTGQESVYAAESAAISADGATAVIGNPWDGGGGAAWVYTRSGSSWTMQQKIPTPGDAEGSYPYFGMTVALTPDGNTAFIGGSGGGPGPSAVWIFTRSGASWTEAQKLTWPDAIEFGFRAAVSGNGDTFAATSLRNGGILGAVYVYVRTGSSWTFQQKIPTPTDSTTALGFGTSVALSGDGNTLIAGSGGDDNGQGAFRVYTRSGSTWTEQQKISPAPGEVFFGGPAALSASGNTALLNGGGKYLVYTRSGSTWARGQELTLAAGTIGASNLPNTLALSPDGTTAFVDGIRDVGGFAVWKFVSSGSTWSQGHETLAPVDAGILAALAFSADGERLLVATPGGGLIYLNTDLAPSSLTATALSRSKIGLSWSDNASNETGYRIERSFDGSSRWRQIATVGANVTSYTHSRQTPLTTYFYRVRATNAAGDSAYSNVASATTLGW